LVVRPGCLAAVVALLLAGCGGGSDDSPQARGTATPAQPQSGATGSDRAAAPDLGFPGFATKNTTRVGGADAIALAAATAQAVFPSRDRATRPQAVALADAGDWRVAVSATQLMARPLRAPLLFSTGNVLPAATEQALERLIPTGARRAAGAQVIRIGRRQALGGFKATDVEGADYAALAQAIDRFQATAAGRPSRAVVVASAEQPGFAMPAAAWAAKSGNPVLWVTRDAIPAATRAAITAHKRPRIYVLGPAAAVSDRVARQLRQLGAVRRVAGADPVTNAIAFARYADGSFGWNVVDPGHGLVFANVQRPLDAAAAAPLSASGTYGPLLLVATAGVLPAPVEGFLLDIRPGYRTDPVRGFYNRGWIIGDENAISVDIQARIDALLEIQPVDRGAGS
jgi:hypothetical protein